MNRNFIKLLLATAALTVIYSCGKVEKDAKDYYPTVKTVSATILTDGTVELKGEIVDEGSTEIEYAGFCMDTVTDPYMLSNQQIASSVSDGKFSVIYSGFNPYKRYYFRSWATNDAGWVYGNTVSLDSIQATPVVIPCNLPANQINLAGATLGVSNVTPPTQGFDNWDVIVSTSNGTFTFVFGTKPSTGIYILTSWNTPPDNGVFVSFYSGFNQGSLNEGDTVYVNQLAPDQWDVNVCNASWTTSSIDFPVQASFVYPY